MRILLLPLTRRQTLLYAQRLTLNEATKPNPWLTWAASKAQKTWNDWGKSETKWKKNTVAVGNRLLDRIEWEEYALKTVHDPKTTTSEKIPVVHPTWLSSHQAKEIIGDIVQRRRPIHQKYRWRWAVVIPLVSPLSLVPVIPNFPFFYAVYRVWSHHKALRGTEYLEILLKSDRLISQPSPMLDKIYGLKSKPALTIKDVALRSPEEELLLTKDEFEDIAKEFEDEEIAVLGRRAITQITTALNKEKMNKQEAQRERQVVDIAERSNGAGKILEKRDQGMGK